MTVQPSGYVLVNVLVSGVHIPSGMWIPLPPVP
jgi:hypothetical protein